MADKQATTQRDGFKSKWGFILACIGSAVGMGNIWRFPIMVSLWGGMTFLIPYFICVILIGSTGVIGEFALGRATGAGPIGAFGKCTELRGNRKIGEAIGFIPVLGSMALAIGYTVVMGWIFKYTAIAITGDMHAMGQDMAAIGGHFDIVAISNLPWIIVAIVASFAIMAMGVSGGIEKANKVMMPVLFFLFVGLGIYIAFLPGASAGYKYIFTLDPKGLANPMVWIFAFGQAFFSLSVAGNGSVIYGSYLPKNENLPGQKRCDFRHAGCSARRVRYHPRHGSGRRSAGEGRPRPHVRLAGQCSQRYARRPDHRRHLLRLCSVRRPQLHHQPV